MARVNNVFKFIGHWKYLADSFLAEHDRLDAMLLRYEDLIDDPETLERLAKHCEIVIDETVQATRLDGTTKRRRNPNWRHKVAIELIAGRTLRKLEYGPRGRDAGEGR